MGIAALFLTGAALSHRYRLQLDLAPRAGAPDYVPSYRLEPGPQLVMVYVGSSACGWSNQPGMAEAVKAIKKRLAAYAREQGLTFRAEGVALDWSPQLGIEHLAKFGNFDEVSAGANWGNSAALRYLWPDESAPPSTPTLLVYRRIVIVEHGSDDALLYGERDRRGLVTKRGAREIPEWADAGVPVSELADLLTSSSIL